MGFPNLYDTFAKKFLGGDSGGGGGVKAQVGNLQNIINALPSNMSSLKTKLADGLHTVKRQATQIRTQDDRFMNEGVDTSSAFRGLRRPKIRRYPELFTYVENAIQSSNTSVTTNPQHNAASHILTLLIYRAFMLRDGNTDEDQEQFRTYVMYLMNFQITMRMLALNLQYSGVLTMMGKEREIKQSMVTYQNDVIQQLASWDTHVQQQIDEYSTLWKQLDALHHKYKRSSVMTYDDVSLYERWGRWLTTAFFALIVLLLVVLLIDYYRVVTSATRGLDTALMSGWSSSSSKTEHK